MTSHGGSVSRRSVHIARSRPRSDHLPTEKTIDRPGRRHRSRERLRERRCRATRSSSTRRAREGFSELDDHDDWLYGLVAHEYTHILHLDTYDGLPTIYNSIFGKTWAPNQIMPRWIIEGIAVYEESKRSAGGRNRGTRFDQYIRIARHAGKDLRLDEVTGASPRQFPRGNARYVYGSHFIRYIFDRFGDDKLREMSHVSGSYPVPFAVNRQIAKVVGKPFTELYDDWKGYLRDRYWHAGDGRRAPRPGQLGRRADPQRRESNCVRALLGRRQGA